MGIETTIALQQKFEIDTGTKCVMCGVQQVPERGAQCSNVDHCHQSNRVRIISCGRCNNDGFTSMDKWVKRFGTLERVFEVLR
jgi:hypothetical protein